MHILASEGYDRATIGRIVARAGVSRPTFYDYFADKDACVVGAIASLNKDLLRQVTEGVSHRAPARAHHIAVEAITAFCNADPAGAFVLFSVSLACTAQAIDARAEGVAEIARVIDTAQRDLPPASLRPDVATGVLVSGIYRLFGLQLRHGRLPDQSMLSATLAWVDSYAVTHDDRRWESVKLTPDSTACEAVVGPPIGAEPVVTHRSARTRDAELLRQRLLFATGALSLEKGLRATSISEITKRAGVGYRRFNDFYADKQQAFLALHELAYRRVLAATFGAYFSRSAWPERIWEAGKVYAELLGGNATLVHIGLLEPYTADARAAGLADDILTPFTLFLYEGYDYMPAGRPRPSGVALEAIAASIFDLAYNECRLGRSCELPRMLPHVIYIVLAPFLGPRDAMRFIATQTAESA